MFFITDLLKSIAVTTSNKLFFIKTMSADSIAISVPEPIASPTSAFTSAGLSLIPSPTNATFLPCFCNFDTSFSLSAGKTSEITLSIPN